MTDETLNNSTTTTETTSAPPAAETSSAPVATESTPTTWYDSLPEDVRSEPSLANFKDKEISELAKSHISAQRELGSRIRIPGPDASKEDKDAFYSKLTTVDGVVKLPNNEDPKSIDAFYTKLGRPERPEGYELAIDQSIPLNPEDEKLARDLAFKAGLTKDQLKIMSQLEAGRIQRDMEAQANQRASAEKILKDKWGSEFDNRTQIAGSVMHHFAAKYPNEVKSLVEGGAGNNPVFLMLLAELGNSYKEQGIISGIRPGAFNTTPEEARNQIAEIKRNPELMAAYLNDRHPKHQEVVDKMSKLYNTATPQIQE